MAKIQKLGQYLGSSDSQLCSLVIDDLFALLHALFMMELYQLVKHKYFSTGHPAHLNQQLPFFLAVKIPFSPLFFLELADSSMYRAMQLGLDYLAFALGKISNDAVVPFHIIIFDGLFLVPRQLLDN